METESLVGLLSVKTTAVFFFYTIFDQAVVVMYQIWVV